MEDKRYQIIERATIAPDVVRRGLMLPDEDFTLTQINHLISFKNGTITGTGIYGRFEIIESTLKQQEEDS